MILGGQLGRAKERGRPSRGKRLWKEGLLRELRRSGEASRGSLRVFCRCRGGGVTVCHDQRVEKGNQRVALGLGQAL